MNCYIILLSYLVFANFFKKSSNSVIKKITSFEAMIVVLFIFSSMRGSGNGDYHNYLLYSFSVDSLEMVLSPPKGYPMELFYRSLAYIKNSLRLPSQFIIVSMSATSITLLYYSIKKYSKDPHLSLLLYYPFYLYFDLHHSRSGLAVNMGLLIFNFLYEGKVKESLLLFMVALTFHRTSWLLGMIYIIYFIENKANFQKNTSDQIIGKVIILLFLTVTLGNIDIFKKIVFRLGNLNLSIGYFDILLQKTYRYLSNPLYGYSFSMLDPRFVLMLITYFSIITFTDYRSKYNNNALLMYFISIILMIVFSENTILTMRLPSFFSVVKIVLVPNFANYLDENYAKNSIIKYSKAILIITFILLCVILSFKQVPYRIFKFSDQSQFF